MSGIPGDPDNPAMLSDDFIIDFLTRIEQARDSFKRLLPTMSPAEQDRLNYLWNLVPVPYLDEHKWADVVQSNFNRPINLPRGGDFMPT